MNLSKMYFPFGGISITMEEEQKVKSGKASADDAGHLWQIARSRTGGSFVRGQRIERDAGRRADSGRIRVLPKAA